MSGAPWLTLPLHFACGRCTQQLVAQAEDAGAFVRCPRCGDARRVPGPQADQGWRPPAGVESAPCPACGQSIRIAARRCFHCAEILDPTLLERSDEAALAAAAKPAGHVAADRASWVERMALASLICGLLPFGITSMVGLVLSRKARRAPEITTGVERMAVVGAILCWLQFTIFLLICVIVALS